jgi:glycosyltransferase involved in cell wall biosynthesis
MESPVAPALRTHLKMGFLGATGLLAFSFFQIVLALPTLFAMRRWYQKRLPLQSQATLAVAWVGSNLDEVNGIALSSRKLLVAMRRLGMQVWMYGVAFHTKAHRTEAPDAAVVMAPGIYSVDQAGYATSELAVVNLRHFCAFLKSHRIAVVEFESPGPVESLCLFACRIIGITTCSHYRTDIVTYSEMLVHNRPGVWFIQTWTRLMTRFAGPVIVPSNAYRDKVAAMGVASKRITKLARGVDLGSFNPERRSANAWKAHGLPETTFRLLYVGRVSEEKNLAALVNAVIQLSTMRRDFHLTVVGDGPYRLEMAERLHATGLASFTGLLTGEDLYDMYASADLFVFPSTTDTFGNSVVEALASGLPCIVSDQGGPCEIVRDGNCGFVYQANENSNLTTILSDAFANPELLFEMRKRARTHALQFTFENSANEFWGYYARLIATKSTS